MPEPCDNSGEHSVTLSSDLEELERLRELIDRFCDRETIPDETRYHLTLALEELAVNAIRHGACRPAADAIALTMRVEGGDVLMTFSDTGVPFDPLRAPPPDITRALPNRPIGGLGIHLVRCLIPDIRYERRDGRNYLYLKKPVNQERASSGRKDI